MYSWDGPLPEAHVRTVADMAGVLAAPEAGDEDPGRPLYFMYRDLAKTPADRSWLSSHALRYDVTVIPAGRVGPEFVKTKGHFHPANPAGTGYPEVYEVLAGKAHFLLQTRDASDVVLVEAVAGDVVVIPPGYGHVTINPGSDELALANIVSTAFESDYTQYVAMQGAAYYEMTDGSLVRNPRYRKAALVRMVVPAPVTAFCTAHGTPLSSLIGHESCLRYLNSPEEYAPEFTGCLRDLAVRTVCARTP